MKQQIVSFRVIRLIIAAFLLFSVQIIRAQSADNQNFAAAKNIEIFNSLFKELNLFYVDSINAKKSIETGINSMLTELDPYTEYYPEDKLNDIKFLNTGTYGGIGAVILSRNNKIIISDPYEGMPAAQNGLRAGDEIVAIDNESMVGKTSAYASEKLKGQPGTNLKITYQRTGKSKPETVSITRQLIHVNTVTWYGVMQDSIGYIYLSKFDDQSAQEVKSAFDDLKKNHHIQSLVLDLRDNGGGVVESAVQIVGMFVPKGDVVLTTKGKIKQWDRVYRNTQQPMDETIPLAVLVNNYSASASEIVAGALQDLDRAVIVGSRTYGKGLVQTTREVAYNGNLKLTTAKYYTPSGRCIQALDYAHRTEDGRPGVVPDSLTSVFYTANKRPVRDGGGIAPDFIIDEEKMPNIIYYLYADMLIFDFATEWRNTHPEIAPATDFTLTDADYDTFKTFVKNKDFKYDRQSDKVLQTLKEAMQFEGYMENASEEFAKLEEKLKPNLDQDLDKFKKEIGQLLSVEIVKRYYYQQGELIQSLKNNKSLDKACEVMDNHELYKQTLSGK